MSEAIQGIHHITAIAGDPQRNVDFYAGVLGLRLVKKTVNFDDPGTYHLYFGDEQGTPGSSLTFFPWARAQRGRLGTGEVGVVSFRVPTGSLEYWRGRLSEALIPAEGPQTRFESERFLSAADPDGMRIELVEAEGLGGNAILGFHSATLYEEGFERSAKLLTETFGMRQVAQEGNRYRYRASASQGGIIDLICMPTTRRGALGTGSVHHIAFRADDDADQLAWRKRVVDLGYNVTPVLDRNYFQSIYFREPGGVLFEIATDPPGFAVDEDPRELGTALKLPKWLEPSRAGIEAVLPKLVVPGVQDHAGI
jgi:catechol 2,3-dioxygenase-like lactoylglutathione lyase family enzyme